MSESKERKDNEFEGVAAYLVSKKGYDRDSAEKLAADYQEASVALREDYLKKYIGKRASAEFGGLMFEVIIKEVKVDKEGNAQFQVTPVNGSKHAWVKHVILA